MSEKTTVFSIHVHESGQVEIELQMEKAQMDPLTFLGILEQVKFNLLTNANNPSKKYDA